MARAFRTLLVWLIMLTLPLQAVSASLMALSMEMPAAVSHVLDDSDCHGSGAAPAGERDAPASPMPLKAKACSPCCAGTLIGALALPQAFLPAGTKRHAAHPGPDFKAHIPEGLERPPKRIS